MFTVTETAIPGVKALTPTLREDARGLFVKTFHAEFFTQNGMADRFSEQYYSVSKKGVLRGLHFQLPPADHEKLVTCIDGEILDAVLDLRVGSPTYGKSALFALSGKQANQLYIPKGLAHGFYVTSEKATVLYNVTTVYAPQYDAGLAWDSAGIAWPDANPLVSDRDRAFPSFAVFKSPFRY